MGRPLKTSTCGSTRMRGIELARAAGMSVQQVRNYEQAGLLPAADRTESGHRMFTPTHQQALFAARALVRAYGWEDAVAVMTAVHSGDLPQAFVLIDGGHAGLDRERRQIDQALQAFELVVTQPADSEVDSAIARIQGAPLRVGQLAKLLGVRPSALRFWESAGLLRPDREKITGYRVYDRIAVRDAHLVHLLRAGNFPMGIIRAALEEMHSAPDGRPERVGLELGRRERQLQRRSWLALRADAALVEYLDHIGLSV